MAGLGEVCSHVAAILFYVEAVSRIQGTETCTQRKCEWILPSYLKKIEYLPIAEIDFTSAKGKKRKLDEAINDPEYDRSKKHLVVMSQNTKFPTHDEMDTFFKSLSECSTKPAILSLVPEYSDAYVQKVMAPDFPQPLNSLYKNEYESMEYHELLKVCESVDVVVNEEMSRIVEGETRGQFRSKMWFKYRAGRITASKMKYVGG